MTKIAILGGGSWGTALSIVLSRSHKAHELSLWMRDPALAYAVNKSRVNELYLPGCAIPAAVAITSELAHARSHAEDQPGRVWLAPGAVDRLHVILERARGHQRPGPRRARP